MKYLAFITAFLLGAMGVRAQITITAGDMPVIGLTIEQGIDTLPDSGIQPGGPGLNTWDFTALEDHVVNTIHFRSPQGLPFSSSFPGATIAVTEDGFYQYLQLTGQHLWLLGTAGDFQLDDTTTFSLAVQITPPQNLLQLPAAYNQQFDENLRSVIQIQAGSLFDSIRIVSSTHRTVKIDAYGLLKTPAGEFNSLRVLEHTVTIDSTFALAGSFWVFLSASPSPDTSVSYGWWGKFNGYAFPLAELNVDPYDPQHPVTGATFVKDISTATQELSAKVPWQLYPNPATDVVNIDWPEADMTGGRIEVYDLQGRLVVEKNIVDQPERLNLGGVRPGFYMVILRSNQGRIVALTLQKVR